MVLGTAVNMATTEARKIFRPNIIFVGALRLKLAPDDCYGYETRVWKKEGLHEAFWGENEVF